MTSSWTSVRPFAKILESLFRERLATRTTLRRLPETDIDRMLAALGGPDPPPALARAVYHETEGNPFFVEEVFQHLKEEGRLFDEAGRWRSDLDTAELQVPEGVRLVIGRRLERVSDDTRKALRVAAVVGRNFDLAVLETAAGIDPDALLDALEEAERAQLITSATSGRNATYTFSHELIRQTLHGNLSLPRRQRLHLRIADAIESASPADLAQQAAVLAHHLFQAGSIADTDKTLRHLTAAGRQALAAAAFEDAVGHFTTALSFERLDEAQRADLLYERGWALRSLAHSEDAIADWQAALSIHERAGNAGAMARTAWPLWWVLAWRNREADARAVAERAERAVPDEPTPERARALALLAGSRGWTRDYAAFERLVSEARRLCEQLGDHQLAGQVLGLECTMEWAFLKVDRAIDSSQAAVEALREAGDEWDLPHMSTHLGLSRAFAGAPTEARRIMEDAEALATRVGHAGAMANAATLDALTSVMLTGALDELERLARRSIERYERAGPFAFIGLTWISIARFWRGDWPEAARHADEAMQQERPTLWAEWPLAWRIVLQAYRGESAWLDEYRRKRDTLGLEERALFSGDAMLTLAAVEALAVVGERAEAHRLYPAVLEIVGDGANVGGLFELTAQTAGIASACGEQWETAEQHFETALQQAYEFPNKIAQPETRRWYAWMLLERDAPGDRDKARTLLGEAIELHRAIGMPKHVEIVERMLERAR